MDTENHQSLNMLPDHHRSDPAIHRLRTVLGKISPTSETSQDDLDEIIDAYLQALPVIEETLWSSSIDADALSGYQQAFRELEHCISLKGNDQRYSFIVVVPVADRPQLLTQCLNSLLTLCKLFHYGGTEDGCFTRVSVIIADDSHDTVNIEHIRKAGEHFTAQGLITEYFGAAEQKRLLQQTSRHSNGRLARIIGDIPDITGRTTFAHKGAAITRNITYLRLRQIHGERDNEKLLFYFIDSDQQFNIDAPAYSSLKNLYAINYFHHLNEIFTASDTSILTGKVVGDPPVSPSVMAGHFLDDITGFLTTLDTLPPEQPCHFHTGVTPGDNVASYHDMANLFGFSNTDESFCYHCTLQGTHNHKDCLGDLASRLNTFFHGEHPTRATHFNYTGKLSTTTPARTIYTGNYIFRPDALKYFIPFATLKLRMAGPVLGRILRSQLDHTFATANLPMLHNRTFEASGQSEFRPGVEVHTGIANLSGEFERQYYGDVMLFTIESLTADGYPLKSFTEDEITETIESTDKVLREQYAVMQAQVLEKLAQLKATFEAKHSWWNTSAGLYAEKTEFNHFFNNIEHNFGQDSECYRRIESADNRRMRLQQITRAISSYPDDMTAWQEAIA